MCLINLMKREGMPLSSKRSFFYYFITVFFLFQECLMSKTLANKETRKEARIYCVTFLDICALQLGTLFTI